MQLQESQSGLNAGRETTEREQALEAQLVEARSIISEQVTDCFIIPIIAPNNVKEELPSDYHQVTSDM